jgi:hypothetical protein
MPLWDANPGSIAAIYNPAKIQASCCWALEAQPQLGQGYSFWYSDITPLLSWHVM